MSGTYAQDWVPRNLGGSIYYDPQKELDYWANQGNGQPMVAVPVSTLRAAARRVECSARTVVTSDEDGELSEPIEIVCRLPSGHGTMLSGTPLNQHFNGYTHWDNESLLTLSSCEEKGLGSE